MAAPKGLCPVCLEPQDLIDRDGRMVVEDHEDGGVECTGSGDEPAPNHDLQEMKKS